MPSRSIQAATVLLMLLALPLAAADTPDDSVTLVLPKGDPERGRAAMLALGCPACHNVAGEKDWPPRTSPTPGPTLGSYQSQQEASRLGMSIFAPSHELTGVVRDKTANVSPMPVFKKTMTVEQFLDVIAFLKSR